MVLEYVEYVVCDCPITGRIVVRHYFEREGKKNGRYK